jgi:hypothetical protein
MKQICFFFKGLKQLHVCVSKYIYIYKYGAQAYIYHLEIKHYAIKRAENVLQQDTTYFVQTFSATFLQFLPTSYIYLPAAVGTSGLQT